MTYVVGVTGGIGSGKTAATNEFECLGIVVVDADKVAREVVEPGSDCLEKIREHFGEAMIQPDGNLNRKALREKIFSDHTEKEWLNKLLHPEIRRKILHQLNHANSDYVILSAPLLLENGLDKYCDRVLVIDVPESLQVERTIARDDTSAEQVEAILSAQMTRDQRRQTADDIILNDTTLAALHSQVQALHKQYLEAAIAHGG
ncbi:dephospho-CoA kinase [Idiomarina piscisalsi]|uniref:dephospho-CoA kinase n=1 Tax=Idiomarina piscisalsi TaxID=1096243 RepID=UPI0013852E7C|nr:dephospho-CoA kinase [Idiomarina piscisalsi]MTJ02779.1 dephospho-CoA kinase [Idiomarina piscisalsi]